MSGVLPNLILELADGRSWNIRAVDHQAATIISEMGRAMRLKPGLGGRMLGVATSRECVRTIRVPDGSGTVMCYLSDLNNRKMQVSKMSGIAATIAEESLASGGLLLHSALAEYKGSGFLMAGTSGTGKSTCSRRLPPPWRSLCDDTTLVLRDSRGNYRAHPWPTWSRFMDNGPGGSWPVEESVPLRGIFFLGQAPFDRLEPVNAVQAAALIFASAEVFTFALYRKTRFDPAFRSHGNRLVKEVAVAARTLAASVPSFSLEVSLNGQFWKEIERVLPTGDAPATETHLEKTPEREMQQHMIDNPEITGEPRPEGISLVVYTGPSMNPTLREPDLLEIRPYGADRVRPGDVVYYHSPERNDTRVVHRVLSAAGPAPGDGQDRAGFRTRGDNNVLDDPYVLTAADIIGRVVAAQRGTRRRVVAGGWRGLMVARRVRILKRTRRYIGSLPHKLYHFLESRGPFDRLLPRSLRPRLLRFDGRAIVFLKLLMGGWTVGWYYERLRKWHIMWPCRLFIDEQTLPRVSHRPVNDQ